MTKGEARAGSQWLALREPVDAAARSADLVDVLRRRLPERGVRRIHDLGCGTGSMARWLAPQLTGPQHWVLYDRDAALLPQAIADPPHETLGGGTVTTETRVRDLTRLGSAELSGASLITASALLDMLTGPELERLAASITAAGSPALIALSVTGEVELSPAEPFDRHVAAAFNAHQRRRITEWNLLGPDAVDAAADALTGLGCEVLVRPSPWHLGPGRARLTRAWLTGWVGAACEQRPSLRAEATAYASRRLRQLAEDRLAVTVHHRDLLVLP